jgi:DNA-directed RNA polymerase specialized sigma24 family protein
MLRPSRKKRSDGKGGSDYATDSDFCTVFVQQMDRLYSLALILTGDEIRAEECLLAAFDSCEQRDLVFKESALSWSRRTIIKVAIRSMSPEPFRPGRHYLPGHRSDLNCDQDVSSKCLLELPAFDRFVFGMSVLEGYSDCDCGLLLGCSSSDVVAARTRAFQQISRRITAMYPGYGSCAQPYVVDADWLECG